MQASIKLMVENWRVNKAGLSTVKLRITHNRKSKYFSIHQYLKNEDWNCCSNQESLDKILVCDKRNKMHDAKLCYDEIQEKAKGIINDIPVFSFDKFEQKFSKRVKDWDFVHNAFIEHIKSLKEDDRLGYAISFNSTLTGIKHFCENKDYPNGVKPSSHKNFTKYKKLKFVDVNFQWLNQYEKFLKKNNKSTSTIGIHARNIRVLFNLAISEHFVKAEYPFNRYKPGTSENNKRALTIEQVGAIANYNAVNNSTEQFAKDMFTFSFLANGMNLTDIFRLKQSDIKGNNIEFIRFKTKAKKNEVKVIVSLTDTLKQIIKRHGNIAINKDAFIFPVLNNTTNETERYARIRQRTKTINHHIKKIAKQVGIDAELANSISSYHARHSWATISKNNGESLAYIREGLGHASFSTTEKYLSSFSSEAREKAANKMDAQIKIA